MAAALEAQPARCRTAIRAAPISACSQRKPSSVVAMRPAHSSID
jgi:hypothetical protein